MGELSPLRRRMIEDMTIRNLSPTTQAAYVRAVEKLSLYFVGIGNVTQQVGRGTSTCHWVA